MREHLIRERLQTLVQRISERIGRHLERKGLLERDVESSHLAFDPTDEDSALAELRGHSIAYRIAFPSIAALRVTARRTWRPFISILVIGLTATLTAPLTSQLRKGGRTPRGKPSSAGAPVDS